MGFSPKDSVLIISKMDTGEIHSQDPVIASRYNVTSDRQKKTCSHFQADLKMLPFENILVNAPAFSYRATASVENGKRKLKMSEFAYRFDGVSHRGGRIR